MDQLRIVDALTSEEVAAAADFFREYAASLDVDLCFQDFDRELATPPGAYASPGGCLLLASRGGGVAGCVGVRPAVDDGCELKRLYVRPSARGLRIGRRLTEAAMARAALLGYRAMQRDTLPSMTAAQALSRSLGFRAIPPYRHNPVSGTVFMACVLPSDGSIT